VRHLAFSQESLSKVGHVDPEKIWRAKLLWVMGGYVDMRATPRSAALRRLLCNGVERCASVRSRYVESTHGEVLG